LRPSNFSPHTHIPVPKVYAWTSDASNPVGALADGLSKLPNNFLLNITGLKQDKKELRKYLRGGRIL
jgi:hypothetical protein